MSSKHRVIIVGGGFAGVKTALALSDDPNLQVTLLSPSSRFEYHGAMYRSATGRSPLEVVLPLSEIFHNKNVEVLLDSMIELRPSENEIDGETGDTYIYDTLVLAVGYEVNFFDIPGMALHAESMYSISEAIQLRHKLVGTFRGAGADEVIDINVIGAGPTGVEIASDIRNFAKIVEGKHGLPDHIINVRLIEAGSRVLTNLREDSSVAAQDRLSELRVEVLLNTKVTKCDEQSIQTDNQTIKSDVTIWTAGNRAKHFFESYPDIFHLSDQGRVEVNQFLQAEDENIYVLGDAADTPYSGMAQTAIHNAIAAAANIKLQAQDKELTPYKPEKPAYVVPIGGEWALLETDDGIKIGQEGWVSRREADRWVLENFLVYELADKHYRSGENFAQF